MTVALTDHEKGMRDGAQGRACAAAMDLLLRYAEALGAERLLETRNVAGVPGAANPLLVRLYGAGPRSGDAIFSHFDLDSDELVEVPAARVHTCHLQGGLDPDNWSLMGLTPEAAALSSDSEAYAGARGVAMLKTCTPYLAGNVPAFGEHCAWMESSAVVYCNSVLGARTNTEGRESTSAAMLTGRIPDWGLHQDGPRHATYHVTVDVPVEAVMDWGMLGYFVGEAVGERIPALTGRCAPPDLVRHKHFGAAAASSGGVEMYHIVGATLEAPSLDAALGNRKPLETLHYSAEDRRRVWESLNARARRRDVDFVMLGCPHHSIEQVREVAGLLAGRRISANVQLWLFTSRAVRALAEAEGLTTVIRAAGGVVLTDTCSAISQAMPPGTQVVALDSAKQVHYLPAITGVEAWFGSTADCIVAALNGRWTAELR